MSATNRKLTDRRLEIWLISPYHTGSHKSWAEGYRRAGCHHVTMLSMAGRFWKWRMQGGVMELAEQARRLLSQGNVPDVVLATDMLNLPAWLGLLRRELPPTTPVALYMHENQLTYPWRPGEKPDFTYGMINWLSQLAADTILFNSEFHRQSWFEAVPHLLKNFPDYNLLNKVEAVYSRSSVLPVGIDCPPLSPRDESADVPLILWNQRWEYDKRPDRFFNLLYRLHEEGHAFRLAVAGENYRRAPQEFEEARVRLADHIVHWGFVPSKRGYQKLLQEADLVISTTDHEFFGISLLEAIAAGAFPLLPNRLSYPELIPTALHPACIYEDEADLHAKAALRLTEPRPAPPSLIEYTREVYAWERVAAQYDALFEKMSKG
ncbi:DUF3524 domain-containing protein [bacterium]|nr:DUF3524 domain-containing protein [bacterium]